MATEETIAEVTAEIALLKTQLRGVDERITSRVSDSDMKKYEIRTDLGHRVVERNNLKDLMELRKKLKAELKDAQARLRRLEGKGGRMVLVRF